MNTLSSQKKTSSILPVRCIMVAALAVLGITEVLRKKEAWNPTSLNENKDISLEVERSHESTETINKISSYLKSV